MDRRDFGKSVAAALAAAAMPASALALGKAGAAATAGAATPPNLYTWAQMIARVQGRCSPDMLAQALHINEGHARSLVGLLTRNGVVGPVNALGISTAMDPLGPKLAPKSGGDLLKRAADRGVEAAKQWIAEDEATDEASDTEDDVDGIEAAEAAPADAPDAAPRPDEA